MQAWINSQSTSGDVPQTILCMRKVTTPAQYRTKFFERVRAARSLSGNSPAQMAELLGVPKDTYHRYETRTLLPHHLIPLFCQLTGADVDWLVRGLKRGAERGGSAEASRDVA